MDYRIVNKNTLFTNLWFDHHCEGLVESAFSNRIKSEGSPSANLGFIVGEAGVMYIYNDKI